VPELSSSRRGAGRGRRKRRWVAARAAPVLFLRSWDCGSLIRELADAILPILCCSVHSSSRQLAAGARARRRRAHRASAGDEVRAGGAGRGRRGSAASACADGAAREAGHRSRRQFQGARLAPADNRNLTRGWMLAQSGRRRRSGRARVPKRMGQRKRGRDLDGRKPRAVEQVPLSCCRGSRRRALEPSACEKGDIEEYERTLATAADRLLPQPRLTCWVLSGSTQSGRASPIRRPSRADRLYPGASPRREGMSIAPRRTTRRAGAVRWVRLELDYTRSPTSARTGDPRSPGIHGGPLRRLSARRRRARSREPCGRGPPCVPGRVARSAGLSGAGHDRSHETDKAHLETIELAAGAPAWSSPTVVGAVWDRDGDGKSARAGTNVPAGEQAEVKRDRGMWHGGTWRGDAIRVARALLPRGQSAAVHRLRDHAVRGIRARGRPSDGPHEKASGAGSGSCEEESR